MRILVTDGMDKQAMAQLREAGHEVVEQFYAPEELGAALREFDAVVVRSKTKVRANHIDEAKGGKLKLIIRGGVGVDNIDVDYAKAAGIDAVTVKLPMAYAGRYVAENEGPVGIAKFVFDKKYRTLVGAHVMSNYSSEFILACAVMIEKEMTVDAIREIVYPHPSVSEIIREAAFAVKL